LRAARLPRSATVTGQRARDSRRPTTECRMLRSSRRPVRSGTNVNVSIQQVPEKRVGKNRLHLDLYTDDQEDEVERLLELGATRQPRIPEEGEDFIVLEDPEGNLFCVIDTTS
ncbi:MAG: VOC family protein, partial [Actinobacteria bacterium]|nr:VOC family protein [Actinomycetota bacterium]